MNIVFQLHRLKYGGGERVLIEIMKELSARGHNITCITYAEEVAQSTLPFNIIYYDRNNHSNILIKFVRQFRQLKKVFHEYKIDICILFGPELLVATVCKVLNIPIVLSVRLGLEFFDSFEKKFFLFSALTTSNKVVLQTNKIKKQLPTVIQKKSVVIYNPILDDLPAIIEKRRKKIVAVGRLTEGKGFSTLLKSIAILKDRKEYNLHIYGDGELMEELTNLAKQLNIANYVYFEGHKEDIVYHIRDAEIFVLSSTSEGMPNALIEAMSMGLACISTDFPSGASRDLIRNYENGIIVPVNNPEETSLEIQKLINNEELRNKLKIKAPLIRELLSKDRIVSQWDVLLKNEKR